jgi:hypothetical protein
VSGSDTVAATAISSFPGRDTVEPWPATNPPKAELLVTFNVPAVIDVVPVYVFVPESRRVPVASLVRFAEPETTPEIVPVKLDAT